MDEMSDLDGWEGIDPRCTCHSIRDFAGGHFGSLYMLGVACGYCEGLNDQYEYEAWWESLTPQEQVQERWKAAQGRIRRAGRRPGAPNADHYDNCPF